MPVVECDPDEARARLEEAGIEIRPGNTEHERWRAAAEDATAVAYADKVVIQGTNPHALAGLLEEHGGRAHVYFDGASRGNPGAAAIGWVIVAAGGIVAEGGRRIGRATNNQAEYRAAIAALEAATAYGFREIVLQGDAELIVKQLTGAYNTNDPTLRELRVQALEHLESFDDWEVSHVPREVNERADELANEAFDG